MVKPLEYSRSRQSLAQPKAAYAIAPFHGGYTTAAGGAFKPYHPNDVCSPVNVCIRIGRRRIRNKSVTNLVEYLFGGSVVNKRCVSALIGRGAWLSAILSAGLLFATGCGTGQFPIASGTTPSAASNPGFSGKVFGGQQAIVGATIQLYAAGTSGYGTGFASLIPNGSYFPGGASGCTGGSANGCTTYPTTDSNGAFTITNNYACPSSASQVYIVATGGNPGLTGNVNNQYSALMAALGTCPANGTLSPSLFINMNEVTTVASVWALQQFMASPASASQGVPAVGAPSTQYGGVASGLYGMQNAFGMVNNMVDISNGAAEKPKNTWSTSESAKINTVADIIADCVNSDPSSTTNCTTLMADATPASMTTAKDTIQAAWYMAQNPVNNVSALYTNHVGATPPFTPLASAPADWTIAVFLAPTYSGTTYAVNTPHHVAIDNYGNVWLSNTGLLSASSAPTGVVELAPNGNVIMNPVNTFTASESGGAFSLFTTPPPSDVRTFTTPKMVAIDINNNAWVNNYGDSAGTPAGSSIAWFNGSTGPGVGGSQPTPGGYYVGNSPWGLAIDGSNNAFVAITSQAGGSTSLNYRSLAKLNTTSGAYTVNTTLYGATPPNQSPGGQTVIAIDTNTNATGGTGGLLWAVSNSTCKVKGNYFAASTTFGLLSQFNTNTLAAPNASEIATAYSGAVVGAGTVPTNCNTTSAYVGQVMSASMANPYGVAVDKNNNIWIVDTYTSSNGFDGLTYLTAPTTTTGTVPSSIYQVDGAGTDGNSTTAAAAGKTLVKAAYDIVDGNNNVWITDQSTGAVVEAAFNGTNIVFLTPGAGGATGVGFKHPWQNALGIAIDPSGNVWAGSSGTTSYYSGTLLDGNAMTVLVGAAGPVVTPLSRAILYNHLGQKP